MFKWLLVLLIPVLIGQEQKAQPDKSEEAAREGNNDEWVQIEMPYSKQNVTVPRELWRVINEILENDKVSEEILQSYAIYPATITVDLLFENPGVTKDNNKYSVTFLEGGGELDLFKYIDGKGKFYVRFSPRIIEDRDYHLLYISESPGRVYGETHWGNGCGNIFDLSQQIGAFTQERGMLVTTSKRHYLHLMAGYYIVFQLVEDKMLLGYIRIKDSRYPQFSCTL